MTQNLGKMQGFGLAIAVLMSSAMSGCLDLNPSTETAPGNGAPPAISQGGVRITGQDLDESQGYQWAKQADGPEAGHWAILGANDDLGNIWLERFNLLTGEFEDSFELASSAGRITRIWMAASSEGFVVLLTFTPPQISISPLQRTASVAWSNSSGWSEQPSPVPVGYAVSSMAVSKGMVVAAWTSINDYQLGSWMSYTWKIKPIEFSSGEQWPAIAADDNSIGVVGQHSRLGVVAWIFSRNLELHSVKQIDSLATDVGTGFYSAQIDAQKLTVLWSRIASPLSASAENQAAPRIAVIDLMTDKVGNTESAFKHGYRITDWVVLSPQSTILVARPSNGGAPSLWNSLDGVLVECELNSRVKPVNIEVILGETPILVIEEFKFGSQWLVAGFDVSTACREGNISPISTSV